MLSWYPVDILAPLWYCPCMTKKSKREKDAGRLAEWLSVPQVATHLGLCTATIYDMIRRGDLSAVWIGRHLRVKPSVLAAWEEAGGAKPGGKKAR